ncbi:uncharacterized protein LOC133791294 [Humulus lupulus]|uniref:uncharacterized protein LOC133791294 n=1 Tax=Humulus lupulus TaxID=3486 RepID=UPI002B4049B7|nr:uncharacterized protein LOC133791294 [Humulus lupulus]
MSSNSSIVSNSVPQSTDSQQTTPPDPQNAEEETNISNNVIFHKNKIFVGGLPHQIEEIELKSYFSTYGKVMHTKIMRDVSSGRGRGFGFITFQQEEVVENVLKTTFHKLKNKRVEVKRAAVEQIRVTQPKIYSNNNYSTFNSDSSSSNNYYNTFNNNNIMYCYDYKHSIYNLHPIMPIDPTPFMYPNNLFSYPQPPYYLIYPIHLHTYMMNMDKKFFYQGHN